MESECEAVRGLRSWPRLDFAAPWAGYYSPRGQPIYRTVRTQSQELCLVLVG